jgi:hypothetical protein
VKSWYSYFYRSLKRRNDPPLETTLSLSVPIDTFRSILILFCHSWQCPSSGLFYHLLHAGSLLHWISTLKMKVMRSSETPLRIRATSHKMATFNKTFVQLKEALYILYIHPWTVSNTDNVNILCTYLMYILTHYKLILTKDWQKTDPTSRQRGQTLVWLRWRDPAATVNYRPVFLSERALQNNTQQLCKRESQGERKIGRGSQMGAWHQDGLADWLSVVMWLWLWLWHSFRARIPVLRRSTLSGRIMQTIPHMYKMSEPVTSVRCGNSCNNPCTQFTKGLWTGVGVEEGWTSCSPKGTFCGQVIQ